MRASLTTGLAAAGALTALAILTAFTTPARAACPAASEKGVEIVGKVVAQDEDAPALTVEHAACGRIVVQIPARDDADLDLYLDDCVIGSSAFATGDMVGGVLVPGELGCM
ncbi:MAG: hypothetical protein KDJ90_15895 [Nitratireductor sp.]|nr:hypothetical protein [Nitratireductor sp.]